MSDKKQQTEEKDELRDLDVREEQGEGVNGGYAPIVPDGELSLFKPRPPIGPSNARGAGNPFISGNHNETLVRGGRLINHSETLVREGMKGQHNETVVLRDLDLPEAEAEGVQGAAPGDINGESRDTWHAAEIEVVSWKLSGASDRRR